ncbi:hypothetical protein ANANG_G00310610 [Anguilla anguilla]|uniref:Uncharacterized protein n=1 Tax=Anguilla anguilla TaxID=7936 RepID=A0A9D3LIE4_ANGAN|nr:hypothetical protein ANANG_G00310610 [Anguilla anguilla]
MAVTQLSRMQAAGKQHRRRRTCECSPQLQRFRRREIKKVSPQKWKRANRRNRAQTFNLSIQTPCQCHHTTIILVVSLVPAVHRSLSAEAGSPQMEALLKSRS